MNLRSDAPKRRRRRMRAPAAPSRFLTLVGLLLIAAAVWWGVAGSRSLDRRLRVAEVELSRLRVTVRDLERAEARVLAAREAGEGAGRLERRVARWLEERRLLARLLGGLSRRMRNDVVLDTLRREGRGFAITGRAASGDAVAAAARELTRLDAIAELDLLFVERDAVGALPLDRADDLTPGGTHRFALEGILGYRSAEPEPFLAVVPTVRAER